MTVGGVGGAGGTNWSEVLNNVADQLPEGAAEKLGFDPGSSFGMGGAGDIEQNKNMLIEMLAKILGIDPNKLKELLAGQAGAQGAQQPQGAQGGGGGCGSSGGAGGAEGAGGAGGAEGGGGPSSISDFISMCRKNGVSEEAIREALASKGNMTPEQIDAAMEAAPGKDGATASKAGAAPTKGIKSGAAPAKAS